MCATAHYRRLVLVLVGLASGLAWLPAAAHSDVGVFVVAGGGHRDGREGGAATTRFFQGYDFQGAPAALADGGFLYPEDERIVRVTTTGRWSTAAGGDDNRPLGDGGPATAARLRRATAVVALADGGFLIADDFDERVRRVFPDGVIRTVAGSGQDEGPLGDGGPAANARLSLPHALAVQPDGGFLIGDDYRVRRVAPDGTINTLAGTGRAGFSGDGGPATRARIEPEALAVQPDGGVLIGGGPRVRRVATDGTITTVAGNGRDKGPLGDGGPAVRARLVRVTGLHALADGSFLLADPGSTLAPPGGTRVRRVDAAGTITTVLGPSAFRDFAARPAYVDTFSTDVPFSVTTVPDGLLMHGTDAILYAPTGTPARPAIRITGAVVRSRRVRLTVAATQGGSASVELLRDWRRVHEFRAGVLSAGRGAVRFDPRRRSGPYEIRVKLTAAAGVAADAVMLVLGRRITKRIASDALDDEYGTGDASWYYGPYRCRRMRARRVDCEVAEQDLFRPRHVECAWMAAVTLGRDGLLHERPYRCPHSGQRLYRAHPRYIGRTAVLRVDA